MKIPSFTLDRQNERLADLLNSAISMVVDSGQFIMGPRVAHLEQILQEKFLWPHAIGVGNGSDALYLALKGLGVGAGHEVITTPFSFFATAGSIMRTGARPVFIDIDPLTYNMNANMLSDAVTARTAAVLPVHLFGLMADMQTIESQYSGPIVEDAAQAIGASIDGRGVGHWGTAAAFSFFPTKNLGALGDGGLIVSGDDKLAACLRTLRVHGSSQKYFHEELGINSRLDEIQAAALLVKLPFFDRWTTRRQDIAKRYSDALAAIPEVQIPVTPPGYRHVFHQYTIRAPKRDQLQAFLREQGIGSTIYYPFPLHLQPALGEFRGRVGQFPEAERAVAEVLSLPLFPELQNDEIDQVVEAVAHFYGVVI